jgi:hypothetical protein
MLDGKPFAIQGNLYDALYDLRPTGNMLRMLWADAICIDQRNLEERKRQVGLMDYIYSRASIVLIWLGCGTAEVEKTFADNWKSPISSFKDDWVWTKEEKYCEWVCTRSYWTRLWVIQEIGLSKNLEVCIGRSSRPWDDFLRCLKHHRRRGDFDYEYGLINNLDKKRKGRHGSENRLEKLLEDFQYAGCKDPRDKIYGLLGLAHDCQDGSIEVDYTKPLFALYTDVLTWFCQPRLPPVGCAFRHSATPAYDIAMRIVRFSHLVQSLLGFPLCPEIGTQDRYFAIAAIGGTILHLGPTCEEMISSSTLCKEWKLCFDAHYSSALARQKLREANEAYDSFLLKHSEWISHAVFCIHPQYMYSRATYINALWDDGDAYWSTRKIVGQTHRRRSLDAPTISLSSRMSSRPRMFLGSDLLLGSAPAEAEEGDLICLFWKIGVVALLRREAAHPVYRVIGKLYLSTGYLRGLKPVYGNFNKPIKGSQTMLIEMDIKTLSILTRPPDRPTVTTND